MRVLSVVCLVVCGCNSSETPRGLGVQHMKHPGDLVGIGWQIDDLRSMVLSSQVRLTMTTPRGEHPPPALFEAIADAVRVRRPDGQYAQLSFDLTRAEYRETMDSVFPDPPEARLTLEGTYFETGWYEASIDLGRLGEVAAGEQLTVGAARIDAKLVDGRFLVTRFSHGSQPVVRRVVICENPAKVEVSFSEGAFLTVPAVDALRVFTESGAPIPGCPMFGESVAMDGSSRSMSYSCDPYARLPETIRVMLPVGGALGVERGDPVLSVTGSAFDELVRLVDLPSDGSCRYFVPQ